MDSARRLNNLFLYLLVTITLQFSRTCFSVQGVSTKKTLCSFPSFLQESCSEPRKTHCRHWSQGRRLAYEGNNAFYDKSTGNERRGEYTWIFKGGKVEVFAAELRESAHPSRISNPLEFYCWQKLAPHIFIISSKNATNKSESNVTYSCVKFRKRGRNVIEYEQSLWRDNQTNLACNASDLITNENPLILNTMRELPDCPADLNGGFQITQLYDRETDKQCLYGNTSDSAIVEADCLGKEGLTIQVPAQEGCSLRRGDLGFHLGLYCYSTAWKEKRLIYFIVKRQNIDIERNKFSDRMASDFLCARFQKVKTESGEEIHLQVYYQPICWRNDSAASIFLIIHLRRRTYIKKPVRYPSEINETDCKFPKKFQGSWSEISQKSGLQTVVINKTAVDISPYGRFHCKQHHIFQHQAPYKCSSLVTGKWPGTGRAEFFMDDYLLVSNFSNGCRPRVTRFGVTDVIRGDILMYRLSQSVPITNVGNNSEEYFNFHVLKQFCSSWLPYLKDPYLIWSRNIEKIITKYPVRTTFLTQHCPLPTLGKGIYHFKLVYADQSECSGPASRIQFGCDNSFTFEVKYDPSCRRPDVSFACIGKAWKTGEFSLVQDVKNKSISCMRFDKENYQLVRLNSPQCSKIDLAGKRPGEKPSYGEKFVFQYYNKCPLASDTRTNDYPIIIIRRRNASRNIRAFPDLITSACLLIAAMFRTSLIGM